VSDLPVSGSLTIVGLGPARPEHATLEARQVLAEAAARPDRVRAYGLAHVRELVGALAPGLPVRPLDYLYRLPGVDRPTAYQDLARMLVRRAFDDGVDVLYLVAGSPLFINDAVLLARRLCATRGVPLRLVHGMSFVELVLGRVYWTGHRGLQLYSAWNVARDGVELAPDAPALLCQLGEFSAGGEALDVAGSRDLLAELRDRLAARYPADHPLVVLSSSGHPDYLSLARAVPLSALADQEVPVYSNLWVPALSGDPAEREVAPA
jgi:tetrapyrrole methylase family protein/MazG family protein